MFRVRTFRVGLGSLGAISVGYIASSYHTSHSEEMKEPIYLERPKTHPCTRRRTFTQNCPELVIFSGNAHKDLSKSIAQKLGRDLGAANIGRFNDGEVNVKLEEPVRGKDVYLIQPTCPPVNENLIELLLTVSALKLASAKRVTVIVPYFGYVRSGPNSKAGTHTSSSKIGLRRRASRDTELSTLGLVNKQLGKQGLVSMFAASDVARMLEAVGLDRIVLVDMQSSVPNFAKGLFRRTNVEYIDTSKTMVADIFDALKIEQEIRQKKRLVIVAPHAACVPKAQNFKLQITSLLKKRGMLSEDINIGIATIIRTPSAKVNANGKVEKIVECVGTVENSIALIVEDLVDTGKTAIRAADSVKQNGATKVLCYATHPILGRDAAKKLQNSSIDEMFVLNTIPVSEEKAKSLPKLTQISVANVLADAIKYLHYEPKSSSLT
eukprot:augustus_masked-scaffold_5-processed-gene-4.36-mRNA-1 protein AED:0.07 eAED:0.13 QI:0/-1/0/1/-1/1/1/0/436